MKFIFSCSNRISHSFAALTRELSIWTLEDKFHIAAKPCIILYLPHVPDDIRRVCRTAANASHTDKQATIFDSSDQSKWKYPGRSWNIFFSDIRNDSPTFLWFSNVNWNKMPCKNTRKWLWSHCSPIGQNNTKYLFCSIRSQHSHKSLEMVWRDSFPSGSFSFIENFCATIFARFTSFRPD